VVAVSHLKACTAVDAMPGSPRCHGRSPRLRPGGPAATKRKRFPTWQGGFCTPGTGGTFTASTDAVPIPSMGTAQRLDL
jgi:hypothetical protein